MAEVGTATLKILPDMDEFTRIMESIPRSGVAIREEITYERDVDGNVCRTIKTTSVVRGV